MAPAGLKSVNNVDGTQEAPQPVNRAAKSISSAHTGDWSWFSGTEVQILAGRGATSARNLPLKHGSELLERRAAAGDDIMGGGVLRRSGVVVSSSCGREAARMRKGRKRAAAHLL